MRQIAEMISWSLCSEVWTLTFPFASCLMAFCPFPPLSPVFPSPLDKERTNNVGGDVKFWKFQSSHRVNRTFQTRYKMCSSRHIHQPTTFPVLLHLYPQSKHPTSRLAPHCFVGSSPWRSVSGQWVAKASLCRDGFAALAGCISAATEDI